MGDHLEHLPDFLTAAFALAGSPGPNTLSLAATGAAFGWRSGLPYMSGLDAGMAIVIAAIASGVTGLVFLVPGVAPGLTIIAALYFVYLAFKIATAPPLSEARADARPPGFLPAVFVSLTNPKGYAAMIAMISGFTLLPLSTGGDAVAKSVLLLGVILLVNIVWLLIGHALTPAFRNPRSSRVLNIFFAVALLASLAAALHH